MVAARGSGIVGLTESLRCMQDVGANQRHSGVNQSLIPVRFQY